MYFNLTLRAPYTFHYMIVLNKSEGPHIYNLFCCYLNKLLQEVTITNEAESSQFSK